MKMSSLTTYAVVLNYIFVECDVVFVYLSIIYGTIEDNMTVLYTMHIRSNK